MPYRNPADARPLDHRCGPTPTAYTAGELQAWFRIMDVCPLIFEPILRPKIWGGRRLQDRLGKALPPDEAIGESWEIADLEDDQSLVSSGPAAGRSIRELMSEWGTALTGRAPLPDGRFPGPIQPESLRWA